MLRGEDCSSLSDQHRSAQLVEARVRTKQRGDASRSGLEPALSSRRSHAGGEAERKCKTEYRTRFRSVHGVAPDALEAGNDTGPIVTLPGVNLVLSNHAAPGPQSPVPKSP